jgi:hypothetical protein
MLGDGADIPRAVKDADYGQVLLVGIAG